MDSCLSNNVWQEQYLGYKDTGKMQILLPRVFCCPFYMELSVCSSCWVFLQLLCSSSVPVAVSPVYSKNPSCTLLNLSVNRAVDGCARAETVYSPGLASTFITVLMMGYCFPP